jgi:hypothetical protein
MAAYLGEVVSQCNLQPKSAQTFAAFAAASGAHYSFSLPLPNHFADTYNNSLQFIAVSCFFVEWFLTLTRKRLTVNPTLVRLCFFVVLKKSVASVV